VELFADIGDPESNVVLKATDRMAILQAFLKSGTPIDRVAFFQDILKQTASASQLSELIPTLLEEQKRELKVRLQQATAICFVFDGTCPLGEAMIILARYVTKDFIIKQESVRCKTIAKSMTSREITSTIGETIITEYELQPRVVIGFARDRATTNNVAVSELKSMLFRNAFDVCCFSQL
jgi:hypothetical protein